MASTERGSGKTGRGQNGGGRRPIDSKKRKRIEAAAREASQTGGKSRNAIAREFNVSPSTVARICEEARPRITWDRSGVKAATEARVTDLKARRAALSTALLDDVDRIRGMLFQERPVKHFSVALGEQTYMVAPGADDLRSYLTAIGIGIDKHLVLVRADSDDRDLPAVDRWLEAMLGEERAS